MIADEQIVLHRAGRNLERLDDKRTDEERQNHRNHDRFEVFADDGLLERLGHGACGYSSVPIFSTARKASCGISTRPTRFIPFLPSFCFSSSFRFRVMSPP